MLTIIVVIITRAKIVPTIAPIRYLRSPLVIICLLLTNGYLTQSVHLLEGIPLLHRTLLAKCLYAAPERAAEI